MADNTQGEKSVAQEAKGPSLLADLQHYLRLKQEAESFLCSHPALFDLMNTIKSYGPRWGDTN